MVDWGGNLPPGAANDPTAPFNEPDHSHEHEWERNGNKNPLFEDGAAMFRQRCLYVEGRWGEGWSCDESRWLRCSVVKIIRKRDGKPNITYLVDDSRLDGWNYIVETIEQTIIEIEKGGGEVVDIDPANDYGDGYVRVSFGEEYDVIYKQ